MMTKENAKEVKKIKVTLEFDETNLENIQDIIGTMNFLEDISLIENYMDVSFPDWENSEFFQENHPDHFYLQNVHYKASILHKILPTISLKNCKKLFDDSKTSYVPDMRITINNETTHLCK